MLAIVIPTHQRADLLEKCLQSVTEHAPAGTQILVVDDASANARTADVISRFRDVHCLKLKRRSGFAAAANAGIRASRGDIVQLLNDDAEWTPGGAQAVLRWFDDPTIGAVAPLVLMGPDGKKIDSAGDRYYLGGVAAKRGRGEPVHAKYQQPGLVFGASASSAFYRRSALAKAGLFPEQFGSYFEDVDLSFRLQRAGFRIAFEPRCRILHRVGASHGRASRKLVERQSANEERVFWRNLFGSDLLRALPKHIAVLAGKAWRRWQEGTLAPFVFGRLRLLGEFGAICRHRRDLRQWGTTSASACMVESRHWGV
ncbi:MAG: glycosyltransferase [Gemmataceae bacterium]|nr:glycosyltransferase [Gemmataceae bacterium]